MYFSPLREGDTYWHKAEHDPNCEFYPISVPFAKGTPTGTVTPVMSP